MSSMKTRILFTLLVSIFVGGFFTQSAGAWGSSSWYDPRPFDESTLIMAHQGGEGEYPSNSMLAFAKARWAGADALDADVHMTSDGVLVLFHDEFLDDRTNGTGAVRDHTYAELRQLDFAYNWTDDGGATYPYRGKGIKVATAWELLTFFPLSRIAIEIKQTTTQAATDLCTMIKQKHAENRVLISSFAQPNMDAFRAACPEVATSATQDEVVEFYTYHLVGFPPSYQPAFSSLQVPTEFNGIPILIPSFVSAAHSYGLKVYAWTIDTPEQAQPLIDLGVDGLNSSYPKRLIDWLRS